jgi:D-serine/D-alanine/glycine transporter
MVFAFFAFILWALAQQADTAQALLITPVWFVLLAVIYFFIAKKKA